MGVVLWTLLGGLANRLCGMERWAPGRNVYWVALGVLALAVWLQPAAAIPLFLTVLAYRLPGWFGSIDMGRNEDTVLRDFGVMFLRGLCAVPVFFFCGPTLVWLVVPAALMAALAYLLVVWRVWDRVKDPYVYAEFAAGASIGFWAAIAWALK